MYTASKTTDILNKIILNVNEKHTMEDYHCGRFTTKASFSIEFDRDEGFRTVLEYTSAEDGKLIGPYYSDYEGFACPYRDEEKGNIKFHLFTLLDYEDINPFARFMAKHFDTLQLTKDMLQKIYYNLFISIAGNAAWSGTTFSAIVNVIDPVLGTLTKGLQTKENIFSEINLDLAAIYEIEKAAKKKKAPKEKV